MEHSPPQSPGPQQRPVSALLRSNRSSSRISMNGSRASDEDGKTAVRVAVRLRPPLQPDDPGYDLVPQRFRGSACQVISPTSLAVDSAQGRKVFVFDRIFGPEVSQEGVWEYLSDSINSFVQGYNVSILAYGQSGAGKSYTMGTTGPREQNDLNIMGIVPRAATALFSKLCGPPGRKSSGSGLRTPSRYSTQSIPTLQSFANIADKNWQMKATYVEIYNEQLRDLLVPDSVPQYERNQVAIREDTKGRIIVTGLRQVDINSVDDLLNALNFGSGIRQTDSTAVNAKSSRSHAVFSLNLIQKKSKSATTPAHEKRFSVPVEAMTGTENWVTIDSKLHFVDLAGSERLKNTNASGERAKEGISINAGLASLGKVISQLSSRSAGAHVSYRDSRLTRLLQDSLGGNAITYMVACINPIEFHLSETLNTVQYAQRARAIQSKPQIQQISEDSDKQAIIDRLRAEVSFLRDQVRLTERNHNVPQERAERQHERELELQNQILDIQENYSALSRRHTKLISDISKANDMESETPVLKDVVGNNALERLKRSNSFAEAVEQVVLEYEKTIQSLEASLSNTRSTLATSESTLLEKESKIAYMETITQQLQTRIQKAIDREANSENYLRDLEARVDGATSGEEKNNALIQGLQQELVRVKENESNSENYISTLEERLAESEQDQEIMRREIGRLRHLVERQRSIGKLDNLLHDLDHMRQSNLTNGIGPTVNGHPSKEDDVFQPPASSAHVAGHRDADTEAGAEADRPLSVADTNLVSKTITSAESESLDKTPGHKLRAVDSQDAPQSPAQYKFITDKLDAVTQELFDLRMEHESTVHELDDLSRKYQDALTTLAGTQGGDEARRPHLHMRSTSYFTDAMANDVGDNTQPSRTLSSELSMMGESSTLVGSSDAGTPHKRTISTMSTLTLQNEAHLAQEMEKWKKLNAQKEENLAELTDNYTQLQEKHRDTLDYVEQLKSEMHKAQMAPPASPTKLTRRKLSQIHLANDRVNRSFASLRNVLRDNFEGQPDLAQSFEIHLNALASEFQTRSERIADLEAEIAAVRKEMESKMTIISGLARERASLKASSPMDMSVASSLRDQLLESENQIRALHESHAARERELMDQIESLQNLLHAHSQSSGLSRSVSKDLVDSAMPGGFPQTPALELIGSRQLGNELTADGDDQRQITRLEQELSEWKSKQTSTLEAMHTSEQQLLKTISELETKLRDAEQTHREQKNASDGNGEHSDANNANIEQERSQHRDVVEALRKEVDQHKTTSTFNASRLLELEQSYANILRQVDEDAVSRELTEKELKTHRDLVSNLEGQIEEHRSALAIQQQGLKSLQESHSQEISEKLAAQIESNERLTTELEEHKQRVANLRDELVKSQTDRQTLQAELSTARAQLGEVIRGVSTTSDRDIHGSNLRSHVQTIIQERKDLITRLEQTSHDYWAVKEELNAATLKINTLEGDLSELKASSAATARELEHIREREKKSSRLVEELEEQLSSNYDQHQATNNRLSALQTERQMQLEEVLQAKSELERELEEARVRMSQLESQLDGPKRKSQRESLDPGDAGLQRSNSGKSNLRKSASHTSLPSPPPAIPLPPLPGSPNPVSNAPSPPTSRHASKDIAQAQLVEDQEARIRTIEKHLFAEKQLTATLEEALTDLESSSTKLKSEMEGWKKRCGNLEEELNVMKKERNISRYSLQQVEEERNARMKVEADRANLEERMAQLNALSAKRKKKSALNCF